MKRNFNYISTIFAIVATTIVMFPSSSKALHALDMLETGNATGSAISILKGSNTGIGYSLRAQGGYLTGEARELVYDFELGYRRKTSELIWDLKNLYIAGVVQTLSIFDVVDINLGLWTAVNEGNGGMVDYDWALDVPGTPRGGEWTDRSISDVQVINVFLFDLNVAICPLKLENFALRVVGGIKQDTWEWDDKAYEYVYSFYSFRDTTGSFGGANVIDYKQTFTVPYAGLNVNQSFERLSLGGYLLLSPGVFAEDRDYHILRDIHFKETFTGGIYFAVGINASLRITDSLFITGAIEYQGIPEIAGNLEYTDSTGEKVKSTNTAGISHSSTMFSAAIGYRF